MQLPFESSLSPERSLVLRLDIFLMTFGCLSQVIKYLDQTNISTSYVSGMKEDLHMVGNDLNYMTTWFNVGYCLMVIPSQIILTRVRPSLWLPTLEIIWGLLTLGIAFTHDVKQVFALRAFLGLCEATAWPGMMTLFMHWYTPSELAKRMGFYHSCQAVGSMMSGALQAAIHRTLNDAAGMAGWRWMFVINSLITIVIGFMGYTFLPDLPNRPNPRAFWFTHDDAELAMQRLRKNGKGEPKGMTWTGAKRTLMSWPIYFVTMLYTATVLASWGYAYFNLWLKSLTNTDGSKKYSIEQINLIPIGGSAINVVFVWIWAILSDLLRTRWTLIVAQSLIGLIPAVIMSVWSVSDGAKFFSYIISYVCLGTAPLIFAWVADIARTDAEQRSLIVGAAITIYYAISAWSQVLVWPTKEAPHYSHGWQVSIALWILVIIMTVALRYLTRGPEPRTEETSVDEKRANIEANELTDTDAKKEEDEFTAGKVPVLYNHAR